jgi:hypothetical protein
MIQFQPLSSPSQDFRLIHLKSTSYISQYPLFHKFAMGIPVGLCRRYQELPKEELSLLELLSEAHVNNSKPVRTTQAIEPKDLVFALGLATDGVLFQKSLDYSMTVEEVYRETARILIHNGNIDLLAYCQPSHIDSADEQDLRPSSLQSWVPDWRTPILRPCCGFSWKTPFFASRPGHFPGVLDQSDLDLRYLQLYGIPIAIIEDTGTPWNPEKQTSADVTKIYRYLQQS